MTGRSTADVLFVDDEEELRFAAAQTLGLADLNVTLCASADAALARIDAGFPGVLVTDIRMPGTDGLTLMDRALACDADLPVILVTGHGDVKLAVQSMRRGAYDFIEKPYSPARLVETVGRALEKRRLVLENRALRAAMAGGPAREADAVAARLKGRSAAIARLRDGVRAVAATQADVLIEGETGTGKEEAARALHEASDRATRPFVQINCAALPDTMIESELFGHEAGAFPGAARPRYGRFEHARGGTVFLDEIDSLPLSVQAKLLQVVQDRTVSRLGSNEPVALDVRFVAGSKRNLEKAVAAGAFRADLLYRLNVVTLKVPGLEARREDIPLLFLGFLAEAAARAGRPAPDLPPERLSDLTARAWPGHVRELRNVAERVALGLDTLDGEAGGADTREDGTGGLLARRVAEHEKSLIAAALAANGGSVKATYAALGLSRKALYEKMRKHGLDREDYRAG